MYFGTRNDEATSFRLLDIFVDAGGFFIDTANIYTHWVEGYKGYESEALLGRWMKARKNRPRLFIATKVGFEIPYYGVQRGLPAATILQECDTSLRNLGVETIDLYYAHCDDPNSPLEESLQAFDRLVKAGKYAPSVPATTRHGAWRRRAGQAGRMAGVNSAACSSDIRTSIPGRVQAFPRRSL